MTVCCRFVRYALVAVLLLAAHSAAWAQTGTASLVGEVTDAQKSVLPGATITLTNSQTSVSQTVIRTIAARSASPTSRRADTS